MAFKNGETLWCKVQWLKEVQKCKVIQISPKQDVVVVMVNHECISMRPKDLYKTKEEAEKAFSPSSFFASLGESFRKLFSPKENKPTPPKRLPRLPRK